MGDSLLVTVIIKWLYVLSNIFYHILLLHLYCGWNSFPYHQLFEKSNRLRLYLHQSIEHLCRPLCQCLHQNKLLHMQRLMVSHIPFISWSFALVIMVVARPWHIMLKN